MNTFTISQMQQFSGIKAHTIRIWEKRYHTLHPDRTQGNTRCYSDNQLRRLLNIVSLMNAGYKISDLSKSTDKRLFDLLEAELSRVKSSANEFEYSISQLIAGGMSFDETYFEKIFSHTVLRYGLKTTYKEVIYPLLERIGLMWAYDYLPPAQEHFIANLIRQKIFTAIDALPPVSSDHNAWLLFLPENELHEIGLLFSHYIIRQKGFKSIYLGPDAPLPAIKKGISEILPENILVFMVCHNDSEHSVIYLKRLIDLIGRTNLYISGKTNHLSGYFNANNNIRFIQSVEQLENELEK